GIGKEEFYYHLKECEFRFNMRGRDMYRFMLRELRERPLN
ncbi:MAG TPA: IS1595 family transposase, partial [Enorma phocaeensis]|nr:IS1595 family transposase [Enorma phocaeensis]